MQTIRQSTIINANAETVFDLSNDIESWPQIMREYTKAEIIDTEGRKIWFRLQHQSGAEWVSWRMLFPEDGFVVAERHEPRGPFRFMQLMWSYVPVSEVATRMTWEMTYELAASELPNAEVWAT